MVDAMIWFVRDGPGQRRRRPRRGRRGRARGAPPLQGDLTAARGRGWMAPAMVTGTRSEATAPRRRPSRSARPLPRPPRARCPTPCCGCRRRPATPRWRGRWLARRPPRSLSAAARVAGCTSTCGALGTRTPRTSCSDEKFGAGLSALRRRPPFAPYYAGVLSGAGRTLRRPAHGSCRYSPAPPPHHGPRQPRARRRAWRSTTRRWSSWCAPASRRATTRRAVVADALEIGARVLAPRADGRERRVRQGGAREDGARGPGRVRRALPRGRRGLRPEVRRGVRAGAPGTSRGCSPSTSATSRRWRCRTRSRPCSPRRRA